ncbi:haloacid dehalogenase superfamily protein, subfamily IA, variant 3 with third motif having DD or ED [Frankia torreyi]|uniref:Haloacid dehalogenase superfamily protein, subfamily IA, variant 3 with third motif having DD or ED n=2 Tax=Frankiaceae TaxID=74712 RepID=A0A0D8BGN1_9ACTN|nr:MULTISPECIES: HAD family phosphatase [Frankia]KJE23139.1 haloacid dehalogenase superfamily protein, subfamily IA, variant 3 with third motif having DD or ED [Frankia torreyi]KQM06662.1 haloacid dehalogenase superfamily protein, subfamily IA, variant 3 with third motif having DD or ED [Frankia sp. CpI1-P]
MGSLAAVFFDMDGLLVDTEPIWTVAEHEAAARLGGEFTSAMKRAMIGHGIDTAVPIMVSMLGRPPSDVPATARFLLRRSAELFREPGVIVPQPGAVELLAVLRERGVPAALVSSSFRDLMDPVLGVIGRELFATTVAGDEVSRRKPDPEPYLTAARMLGVDPRRCVVLEDSPSGARAGVAAGCATILVPSMPDLLDPTTTPPTATPPAPAPPTATPRPTATPPAAVPPAAVASDGAPSALAGSDAASADALEVPAGLAAIVASLHDVTLDLLDELLGAHPVGT